MNNLHISLTEFRNESRVLKQGYSILNHNVASKVYIASLHLDGLGEEITYSEKLVLNRFKLSSRRLGKNLIFQIFKYFEFFYRIAVFYRRKNIKIINIHSVALMPFGVFLKYLYNSKLCYDTHELETETGNLNGLRKKLFKLIEQYLIRKCDLVFVVGENIADWYEREYNITRPAVVKNAPRLFELNKKNHFRDNLGIKENSLIILYQGGLSIGRGVDILIDYFKERNDDKVVIVFMGYGELENEIVHLSKFKNNVFYHRAVPPEIVLEYTSSADIGIHIIQNTCLNHYYCMPNKLFEYAMAGLPVIVSNMKEMKDIVEKYEMGAIVEFSNINSIDDAIKRVLDQDLVQLTNNARRCATENAWEKQEIIMINEYKKFIQ